MNGFDGDVHAGVLGAHRHGDGTRFALFSGHATAVELLLYEDSSAPQPARAVPLCQGCAGVWSVVVPGVGPGQCYAYRVDGPWAPAKGHRFNKAKVLVDPYARALAGSVQLDDALYGHTVGHAKKDREQDSHDSGLYVPRSVVIDPAFDWGDDMAPRTPWRDTILYELHVKGFTQQHPEVPPAVRGTYAGLATEPALDHLCQLGVTAVELLPIQSFVNEPALVKRDLVNYWGYNTLGFFAPHGGYAAAADPGEQVREFKAMVKALHRAGLEVILDVVYNHTAESGRSGPFLSFKGIDNSAYYCLRADSPGGYVNHSGCGNTLNLDHAYVLQMVLDSLRYWVEEMHVDGFRFDLATSLARHNGSFDPFSPFFAAVHQDPVLSRVKLIAEPWDLGPGGYRLGGFPVRWAEWNDRYRDTVRRFWRGDGGLIAEMASRVSGSSDVFQGGQRTPQAGVNFITAHDGFTLHDLVSYEHKHNRANAQKNRDGTDANHSANCGVEGPTDDPTITALRERRKRSLLATLLLSQGVPMLTAGDELGRTQQGNNNAYCQDNELSWLDWRLKDSDAALLKFTQRVIALRKNHDLLRKRTFFTGQAMGDGNIKDITWLRPNGKEMASRHWHADDVRAFGALLADASGASLLLLLNADPETIAFNLPECAGHWEALLETGPNALGAEPVTLQGSSTVDISPYGLMVLERRDGDMPGALN